MAVNIESLERVAVAAIKTSGTGGKRKEPMGALVATTCVRYIVFISPKIRAASGKERCTLVRRVLKVFNPIWAEQPPRGVSDTTIGTQSNWAINLDGGKPGTKGRVKGIDKEKSLTQAVKQAIGNACEKAGVI